jgi:RHS repeat-associated protein
MTARSNLAALAVSTIFAFIFGSVPSAFALGPSLFVVNTNGNTVTSYPLGSNGDVTPTTTIGGSNTGMIQPYNVAIDPIGDVYVTIPVQSYPPGCRVNCAVIGGISVFASGSTGDVTPLGALPGGGYAVASDGAGNILATENDFGAIAVFPAGSIGGAQPSRFITGSNDGQGALWGVAGDPSGYIYVTRCPCYTGDYSTGSVNIYSPGSSGNVPPVATIAGDATGLHGPIGIALDSRGSIYVTNYVVGTVTVYAAGSNGNVPPIATIVGPDTGLRYPEGIAVDPTGNIYVANLNNKITVYSPGSTGDAIPIATISGPHTGLNAPDGLAIGPINAVPPPNIGSVGGSGGAGGSRDKTNQQGISAEPVSTGNGNYYYQHTDFTIPGRGLPVTFERAYNVLDNYSGPLGANWTHSYNIVLTAFPAGAVIKWGDGHGESFALSGTVYTPQPGVFNQLVQNPDGSFTLTQTNRTKYNFTPSGQLSNITDKNGNAINLTYDTNGLLTQITDTVGRVLSLSYDANQRITQIIDPAGRTVSYQYSANNDLTQVTDPAGGVTSMVYDGAHRVTSITLPNGKLLLQNIYDSQGRTISQSNGRGFTTTFAYNTPSTGQTTITDPLGNSTVHTYDSALRIVQITDPAGGTRGFTYDSNNDRTSVTDPNGNSTLFSFDSNGNVLTTTDPSGNVFTFSYDANNDVLTSTNPLGFTTQFSYDANGNLTGVKDPLLDTTSLVYDGAGELISKTDANGHTASFSYDSKGNVAQITDALGDKKKLAYDLIGRLVSATDGNGHVTKSTYDLLGNLTAVTDALKHTTAFAYDPVSNLLSVTDAKKHKTAYAYDAVNNLTSVTDPLAHVTSYTYDANNNRVSFINANGAITAYSYDGLNRLIHTTDPLGYVTSNAYDPDGNLISKVDANAKTTNFSFDQLNRLTGIAYPDGTSVSYVYDANGNRTSMLDWRGTTTYAYDALNRVTSVKQPDATIVSYGYDPVGNRAALTYPGGTVVSYTYDPANRLASAADSTGSIAKYAYDPANNLLKVTYPNTASETYSYDAANRLTQVANAFAGSSTPPLNPVTKFTYVLDAVGNRTKVTDGGGIVTTYGYFTNNQLGYVRQGTTVTGFRYDPAGNRILAWNTNGPAIVSRDSYAYDKDDRLTLDKHYSGSSKTTAKITYVYDGNGNRTNMSAGAGTRSYFFDGANRLIGITGGPTVTFAYDGDGNRVAQGSYSYVNDVANSLPVVLQESGDDGPIRYEYGRRLVLQNNAFGTYFYQHDGLGSVAGLTDFTGNLKVNYAYDAWGNIAPNAPLDVVGTTNKFRYTGEALDPSTGFYYLRARYYDPTVGRFLTVDPKLTNPAQTESNSLRYEYAGNNPVTRVDPSGLSFFDLANWGAVVDAQIGATLLQSAGGFTDLADLANARRPSPLHKLNELLQGGADTLQAEEVRQVGHLYGVDLSNSDSRGIASRVSTITTVADLLLTGHDLRSSTSVGYLENITDILDIQTDILGLAEKGAGALSNLIQPSSQSTGPCSRN